MRVEFPVPQTPNEWCASRCRDRWGRGTARAFCEWKATHRCDRCGKLVCLAHARAGLRPGSGDLCRACGDAAAVARSAHLPSAGTGAEARWAVAPPV